MGSAKVVWILFGNMDGVEEFRSELEGLYRTRKKEVEDKGYTLGFSQPGGTSLKGLRFLIHDPSTYAVVWHSHGSGDGGIYPAGESKHPVIGSRIGQKGPNLERVALFACDAGKFQWRETLGITPTYNDAKLIAPTFKIWPDAEKGWKQKSKVQLEFVTNRQGANTLSGWLSKMPDQN